MLKSMFVFLIVLNTVYSLNAYARDWSFTDYVGAHYGAGDSETVTAGNTSAKVTAPGSTSFMDGFELFYQPSLFGVGFIFEYNNYAYSNGSPSDAMIGLLFAPRAQITVDDFKIWGSVAVGVEFTTLGTTSAIIDGSVATTDSSSLTNFVWSPRVGIDYQIDEKYFLGIQESYTNLSPSIDVTVSGTTVHEADTRHFFASSLRFGFNFGEPKNSHSAD